MSIDLSKISTKAPEDYKKKTTREQTQELAAEIHELQKILYAQGKYSLLIILQGLDASGKDGVVNKVFSGINPLGCVVKAFKKPTDDELKQDFLWRVHPHVPAKGMIHIFNRSHYEDVLVPKVEGYATKEIIERRYTHINNFEELLKDNGTVILKFYLHISKEEQKIRLQERKDNPEKFWKHSDGDWETAKKWDDYRMAYHEIFKKCSTTPWTIVPSDDNWYKEYLIAKTINEAIKKLDLKYPGKS
jgi:PPK2 family polyphosphate:nucleotide phosphotransferase